MDKKQADERYKRLMTNSGGGGLDNIRRHMKSYGGGGHIYSGKMELSNKHMYINLHFDNVKDKVQMIFHRPDADSNKYIGGLGAMLSVSKGKGHSPCLQYIALSDTTLSVSEEEIAAHMLMRYPNLKTYDSVDDLVDTIIQLYRKDWGEDLRLTEEQKRTLVRVHMDKIVNDTVERNLFRTNMITLGDDDDFYHFLKRAKEMAR